MGALMPEPKTTECRYCHGTGLAPMGDGDDHPATKCGFCEAGRMPVRQEPWPLESFDPWSELTRERDGYREDAIAEQHERERQGY
tara:strand:- start:246 stop:500 length:255 start_codon:yes stop_codon:yes gene_type:complete